MEKKCSRCGELKGIEEFYNSCTFNDLKMPWCKDCFKVYKKNHEKDIRAKAVKYDELLKQMEEGQDE